MSWLSKLVGRGEKAEALPSDPIDAFWKWWERASVRLAAGYDRGEQPNEALVQEISERVNAIHEGLAWETGRGKSSQHHFALTAEGDPALRVMTQRWLARAPKASKSWEYYAARQGSGGDARRTLTIDGREFDYEDFRIGLDADESHALVHVVVYHPKFSHMSEGERAQPLFLFLDDVLGEDAVTSWIGSVDSAGELPDGAGTAGELVEAVRKLRVDWDDQTVSLLEGKRDDAPVIAVMRLKLKRLDYLLHDHHLELLLDLRQPREDGLCFGDENEELGSFEDGLLEELGHRAVWIGHETVGGQRIIHFHADGSPALQDAIQRYTDAHGDWESELSVAYDPGWKVLDRY